ncbi:type II secretion system F family protein [Uliginosibacterium sp. H3]|uniref:Type II secretion system F family protein n=1 Tax=Uliginosibacterium silvisoli TaxID=3114758 RepID=A0ABU6K371_9RHOO|nr:type II secretion system F family protein [Uliginosibacterium sp. H3]
MASFSYKARDAGGALAEGALEAPDAKAAADVLISRGLIPVDIALERARSQLNLSISLSRGKKVSVDDIMFFSRQMYTLMKAGVPILQALGGLRDSAVSPAFAELLRKLRDSLDAGRELSVAMQETDAFDSFYISMVRIGEQTGGLDRIFLQLFEHLRFEKSMRAKIKAALRYPTFVVIAMAAALVVINMLVIPAFAKVFDSFHAELPLMTRILLGVSNFSMHYWYIVLGVVVFATYAVRAYANTSGGRYAWDRAKLRLPIVGDTINKAMLARLTGSFALAFRSGLPVLPSFTVVAQVIDNAFIAQKLDQMKSGVERGESILRTAAAARIFTPVVLQMIAVGEESGDLDGLLQEIADMYDREVEYEIDNLSARIEPLLIVCLGAMVLVLALGIFMPIWNLSSAMMGHH